MTRYIVSDLRRVAHSAPTQAPTRLPAKIHNDGPMCADVDERYRIRPKRQRGGDHNKAGRLVEDDGLKAVESE